MNVLINIVGVPLGFIMRLIYNLVSNYGVAIILFTLVTKLILFPVSYKQQKNSARLQLINPKLAKLREKYKDKPEKLQMEQMKLYQEENINPYSSCVTAFIPLILLWGVLAVVYKPMTYIMQYDTATVEAAKSIVIEISDDSEALEKKLKKNSMRQQLFIMDEILSNKDEFEEAAAANEEYAVLLLNEDEGESFLDRVEAFGETFTIGNVSLSEQPSTKISENSSIFLFLLPFLSGLMQLILTIYMQRMQKKRNPDMPGMGSMNAMLYIMPLFSVWLAFTVPAGVGFYWLCSSAFSLLQTIILYAWFNDKRVEAIGEAERAKAKKANRRPSMMQRMMEQQEEMLRQQGGSTAKTPSNRISYSDDDTPKLSRTEMEEYNTSVIREARKHMEEKYGENTSEEQNNTKKKKK